MPKQTHILVIRLSAMGDVAMTVPVLRALIDQYPEVNLTVLTKPFFRPLFKDIPRLEIIDAHVNGKHKGVFGLYKLSKTLNKLDIDAVADLHNVLRSKILKRFLKCKTIIQIDKGRKEKKALISGQYFEPLKTTHQRYADVFNQLGFPIDMNQPNFPKPAQLNQNILKLLGSETCSLIGVAPFAAFRGKAYPFEKMEQVIHELSKDYKIILFGAKGVESERLERIANQNSIINLAGKLNLTSELEIISNLKLMISMDSGNAHLAAMFGIKVLSIWGVTHPHAGFYPFHQDLNNAVLADRERFPKIPTSVYGNAYPNGYEAVFDSISPEQIISKALTLLK